MNRTLELYADGRLYEYKDDQAVKYTDTQGDVNIIIDTLKFSTAKKLEIAPPNKQPPSIADTRRGERHINDQGLNLLKSFEGCELKAYDDGGKVWTIGYGHTKNVTEGMTITQEKADQFFREDLEKFELYVEDALKVTLNGDQFSALVCFCFNVGPGPKGFEGSTLLKLLNQGDFSGAAQQFPRWNKVGGKSWLGLTRRRLAEQALFNSQPWESFRNYNGPVDVFGTVAQSAQSAQRTLKLTDPTMRGEDVKRLQEALVRAEFSVGPEGPDGFFGKATDTAVRQLQKQKGLKIDGIAGGDTRTVLGL